MKSLNEVCQILVQSACHGKSLGFFSLDISLSLSLFVQLESNVMIFSSYCVALFLFQLKVSWNGMERTKVHRARHHRILLFRVFSGITKEKKKKKKKLLWISLSLKIELDLSSFVRSFIILSDR